jgi:iron complex transport system permease protein
MPPSLTASGSPAALVPSLSAQRAPALVLGLLLAALLVALWLGLGAGAAGWRPLALQDLWRGDEIVAVLRGPRVALAAITGASLALSGIAMQTVLQNDLADPYVLGLAGGASAGAALSLALAPSWPPGPAAAAGAAAAAVVVRALAGHSGGDRARLILAGVAVGSALASVTGLVVVLAPADRLLRTLTFWLFGGMGTPNAAALLVPAAILLLALCTMQLRAERMDRLLLGDDVATSLGIDVRRFSATLSLLAVLLTASAVSVAGLIGFVGLMAPHVARQLLGPRHRSLLPAAALIGAVLLVGSDTLARTAFAPIEVPVGLLTAALGGPFFLWLLQRRSPWIPS